MSHRARYLTFAVALALTANACGGGSEEEPTLASYLAQMETFADEFASNAPDSLVDSRDYPVGGDLVPATELYDVYDELLASWRSLTPPPEISRLHDALVEALDELQTKVGEYLMDEALHEGELDFETIGAKVGPDIVRAQRACNDLRDAVSARLGARADVFGDCEF